MGTVADTLKYRHAAHRPTLVRPRTASAALPDRTHPSLHLQRTTGNQRVQRLLQAQAPASMRIPMPRSEAADDVFEREADRVAGEIAQTSEAGAPVCTCDGQGGCATCQNGNGVSASMHTSVQGTGLDVPPSIHEALQSSGKPLDRETRAFMEPRFGHDFSAVRIHADGAAQRSAADVGARAYTVGRDIVVGAHAPAASTLDGRRLMAHELTHVVQQSTPGAAPALRRFAEGEHKAMGDVATGQRTIFLAPDMPVTYGDIVALGGDLFGDWGDIIRLARTKGITAGTRGEVWYAILVKVRANLEGRSEKEAEAEWLGKVFDEKAKAAVEARYTALAADNISHFANPREGDAARSQALKDAGHAALGAGATYRANHATALMVAAAIGARHRVRALRPERLNDALILEAFGGHFLTDAFAAGHQQTARASVKGYWDAKVPQFWTNFQQWLAARVTLQLRKSPQTLQSRIGSHLDPQWVTEQIALPSVRNAVAKLPQLGFGDLMSGAIHDYFNKHGAQADVAGRRIKLVGDSRLLTKAVRNSPIMDDRIRHVTDESRDTFNAAVAAVQAGIEEIYIAAEMGRAGDDPERVPVKILNAGGGLFAAEQLLPTLAPDAATADPRQRSLNWKLPSYLDVLADSRLAEGLTISIDKYANQVGSLSGLSKEQMDAVMVVLIFRMKGGQDSVVRLIKEVIEYKPIQTDVGFNPEHLQDLVDFRRQINEGAFH